MAIIKNYGDNNAIIYGKIEKIVEGTGAAAGRLVTLLLTSPSRNGEVTTEVNFWNGEKQANADYVRSRAHIGETVVCSVWKGSADEQHPNRFVGNSFGSLSISAKGFVSGVAYEIDDEGHQDTIVFGRINRMRTTRNGDIQVNVPCKGDKITLSATFRNTSYNNNIKDKAEKAGISVGDIIIMTCTKLTASPNAYTNTKNEVIEVINYSSFVKFFNIIQRADRKETQS